jgi:hypothetical protein
MWDMVWYYHDFVCDRRQGLNRWMDLLTTYTHDWELREITAPSLISSIEKSPHHSRSLSHSQVLSSEPPAQNWTVLNWLCLLLTTYWHGSCGSTPFPTVTILLHAYSLQRERVYRAVAQKRPLFTKSQLSNGSIRPVFRVIMQESTTSVLPIWWLT